MLVVDRVELRVRHQLHQVRELDADHAVAGQHLREAGDEVVDVGHVGQHVVRDDQVDRTALLAEPRCRLAAEELFECFDAQGAGSRGGARGGLDAQAWNSSRNKILEQIAIIGCNFNNQAFRREL